MKGRKRTAGDKENDGPAAAVSAGWCAGVLGGAAGGMVGLFVAVAGHGPALLAIPAAMFCGGLCGAASWLVVTLAVPFRKAIRQFVRGLSRASKE
jgi:hypothetical protein